MGHPVLSVIEAGLKLLQSVVVIRLEELCGLNLTVMTTAKYSLWNYIHYDTRFHPPLKIGLTNILLNPNKSKIIIRMFNFFFFPFT